MTASAIFQDQVVFTTGSARRVGKAIALAFAEAGAHVVIHHSSPSSAEAAADTADQARAFGVETLVIQGDHSDPEAVAANFAAIHQRFGRLDVLVNSASIFMTRPLLEIPPQEWQSVMDINLSGPLWCTQQAVSMMRAMREPQDKDEMREQAKGGAIINIGDNSGWRPWANRPHHSISKAGLLSLTRQTAAQLAAEGIRVNAVIPGPVLPSPGMSAAYWDEVAAGLPLERAGDPDDVARAVLFLAGQSHLSGEVLRVDGGEYLTHHD